MDHRGVFKEAGFWALALLWLPAGVVAQAAVRFAPGTGDAPELVLAMLAAGAGSLAPAAISGLPLALGCRRLWRLGSRRGAALAGIVLGAITVAATVAAGLLGPLAVAICALVLSLPVWIAWWRLARHG